MSDGYEVPDWGTLGIRAEEPRCPLCGGWGWRWEIVRGSASEERTQRACTGCEATGKWRASNLRRQLYSAMDNEAAALEARIADGLAQAKTMGLERTEEMLKVALGHAHSAWRFLGDALDALEVEGRTANKGIQDGENEV